jgi:predicted Zn-dependent protease
MKKISFLILFVFLAHSAFAAHDYRQRASDEEEIYVEDDIKAEVQFGREVAGRILGRYKLYDDEKLTRYVNLVGKAVAANAGRPEIEFRFGIVESDVVNAYAAPGGYIFITKAALDMVRDESELAAMLAHEIGHVANKHIVKELNIRASDDSPVGGFARMLGASGDPAKIAFLKAADKAMEILIENGYRKEDELDADRTGTVLLALSGYDPTALKKYLQRILSDEKRDSQTHPASGDRIAAIDKVISEEALKTGSAGKERFDGYTKK